MINLGSKSKNLNQMRNEWGLNVPEYVALPFEELVDNFANHADALTDTANRFLNGTLDAAQFETTIASKLKLVHFLGAQLQRAESLGAGKVSFRTSAALEDGREFSFAGQYESFLDVDLNRANVEIHARKCFESMLSLKVLSYAKERGIREFKVGGSLIVQRMFYGKASGVLFSENGSGQLHIAYVNSWRNKVVEGEDALELLINRNEIASVTLPWQLKKLCEQALAIERQTGTPVDVEWAYDNNELAFLQYRPITKTNRNVLFEWDSTNISENYPGITLPLTYSLIRQFYAGVYSQFFKLLGASTKDLDAQSPVFDNMLGYVNGHVHYRISNWYQALKLLPGKRNQEYFEAMLNPVKKRGEGKPTRIDIKSILIITRFLWLLINAERLSKKFARKIDRKIAFFEGLPVEFINAATIVDAGKKIRIEILADWATTILNDMRLMIFHGVLKRIYSKNENPQDYLALIQGLSQKSSIRPLAALSELGKAVRKNMDSEGVAGLRDLKSTKSWPAIEALARAYTNQYGARTPGELKLENQRITDQVENVLELAINAADSVIDAKPSTLKRSVIWPRSLPWAARPLVLWVADNTRRAIDWRERFRFNRAQTFNLSRRSFDALGSIFEEENLLGAARDIYWLTDQEIDDTVNGHAPTYELKNLVESRKIKFAEYEKLDQSLAVQGSGLIPGLHIEAVSSDAQGTGLGGNGVAPGVVTAEVVVVKEFDSALDVRGKVLVVHYIDPGWTLLFTQAAAIVAERGNALSHAAIIAREIGIPCVVAAVGATTALQSGEKVTVNGNTGSITRESL